MAVISDYIRYNGETIRFGGFGSDNMIIDNQALSSGRVAINNEPVDIRGLKFEISASNNWNHWYKVNSSGGYWANYACEAIQPDISADVSPFGKTQFIAPSENGESFILTNRNTNSKAVLTKLDAKGNVIGMLSDIDCYCGVFIDNTPTHIAIMGYNTGSYTYINYVNKETMKLDYQYYSTVDSYTSQQQCVFRDNDVITFIEYNTGKPAYYNKNVKTGNKWVYYTKKDDSVKDWTQVTYSTGFLTNISKAMGNGWHYKISNSTSTDENNVLKLQAIKMDHETKTYETVNAEDFKLTWSEKCDVSLKNIKRPASDYNKTSRMELVKLEDDLLGLFVTVDPGNQSISSYTNSGYKSFYYIIKIDGSQPGTAQVVNAQYFKYGYVNKPLIINKNKILMFQEEIAVHSYKVNPETFELDLVWEISTPNLYSAAYYNGYLWWINGTTNELNDEKEANYVRTVGRFEKTSVDLENLETPVTIKYFISVYDIDNQRIEKNLRLRISSDAIMFASNSSRELDVRSSTSADTEVEIKCINAGKSLGIDVEVL